MNNFENTVREYKKLKDMEATYLALDYPILDELDMDDFTQYLIDRVNDLEEQEKNVMIAWANATKDINPNMLNDIENGRLNYERHFEEFLNTLI